MEGRFAAALQDASRQLIIQRLGSLYLFSYSSSSSSPLSPGPPPLHLFPSLHVCHLDLSRWDSNCRLSDCRPALSVNIALLLSSLPLLSPFIPSPALDPFISFCLSQIVFPFCSIFSSCTGSPRSACQSLLTSSAQTDPTVLFI